MPRFKNKNQNDNEKCIFKMLGKFTFCFTTIIIFFVASCQYNSDESFNKHVQNAIVYRKKNDHFRTINELNEALKINPLSSKCYVFRGETWLILKKYDSALKDFSSAIEIAPTSTLAVFKKGYTYYLMGWGDSAIHFYNLAIQSKGSDSVYIEFNDDLFKDGPVEEDVHMPEIRFYRGLVFYDKDEDSLALNDLYFSLSYNYNLPRTKYYIGIILLVHSNKEKGCKFLNEAKALGNERAETYLSKYCN